MTVICLLSPKTRISSPKRRVVFICGIMIMRWIEVGHKFMMCLFWQKRSPEEENLKEEKDQNRRESQKGNRREDRKGKQKPQYGMLSNVLYMVRHAAAFPRVLWMLGIQVVTGVMISVVTLYMAPSFLRILEEHASVAKLSAVIGGFSLALILLNGLETYIKINNQSGRVAVRLDIMREMNRKVGSCSYPLLNDQKFQDRLAGAKYAVSNNIAPAEKIWDTLYLLLKNGICFCIYLALMVNVKPVLIVATVAITVADFVVVRRFDNWNHEHQEEEGEIIRKDRYLYNSARDPKLAKDIRIFGMKEWLWDIREDICRLRRNFLNRREKNTICKNVTETLLDLLRNGCIYTYLLIITLQGGLSASEFLLYFTAASGFTGWVTGILANVTELNRQSMKISLVRELCGMKEPFLFEGGRELVWEKGVTYEFEFRDVTFRYPDAEKPVLEHFNLKIKGGEKLAVVGLNGAGKTTLVKLLCGFLDPDSGQVLLNGVDIREYNRRDYYKLFGAVFQEFSVLGAAIAENVAQSAEPDMERVRSCVEQAGLKERIERFPDQYETKLGKSLYPEEAVELSGGEMQRLMLARMLYKHAPVMVLDEPTAALDALAERDMYERYADFSRGNTAVFISHRLASTRFCDRVILLDGGRVLEEGTHEYLMEQGGKYAELFEIQSEYYKESKD